MRTIGIALLLIFACGACSTAAPPTSSAPALKPAATPADALIRMMEALADGDEAAYRRIVVFVEPSAYAQAVARQSLAAARLHRAVRERGVTGKRIRKAGFDTNQTLLVPAPASGKELDRARDALRREPWKIEGDIATMPSADSGSPRAMRFGKGWVVLATDVQQPAEPKQMRLLIDSSENIADITIAATAQVEAGRLRTIRQINDFIKAERDVLSERELVAIKAAAPTGPIVKVIDAETGEAVAGIDVIADFIIPPSRIKQLTVVTAADGSVRLPKQPDDAHSIHVKGKGYVWRPLDRAFVSAQGDRPQEIHLKIAKPIIVEVMLVLPDDRRMALSVYEGRDDEAPEPGTRQRITPTRLKLPVAYENDPPKLPDHNPMLRLHLPGASPHKDVKGVVHRVTAAQTKAGRELPVFRDAPPADPTTFGLYDIGVNGFEDTVFVIGTLADARAVEAGDRFQSKRNARVLGPAPATTRTPTTTREASTRHAVQHR